MDFVTHALTGLAVSALFRFRCRETILTVITSVIPDIGELPIQYRLTEKHGVSAIALYDHRTTDPSVAGDLSVTWLYDTTHSLTTVALWAILGWYLPQQKGYDFRLVALGWFLHVLLDVPTHGEVWGLKLLFPFSNDRFLLGSNWWDWQPQGAAFGFTLPVAVMYGWIFLFGVIGFGYWRGYLINFLKGR